MSLPKDFLPGISLKPQKPNYTQIVSRNSPRKIANMTTNFLHIQSPRKVNNSLLISGSQNCKSTSSVNSASSDQQSKSSITPAVKQQFLQTMPSTSMNYQQQEDWELENMFSKIDDEEDQTPLYTVKVKDYKP